MYFILLKIVQERKLDFIFFIFLSYLINFGSCDKDWVQQGITQVFCLIGQPLFLYLVFYYLESIFPWKSELLTVSCSGDTSQGHIPLP